MDRRIIYNYIFKIISLEDLAKQYDKCGARSSSPPQAEEAKQCADRTKVRILSLH